MWQISFPKDSQPPFIIPPTFPLLVPGQTLGTLSTNSGSSDILWHTSLLCTNATCFCLVFLRHLLLEPGTRLKGTNQEWSCRGVLADSLSTTSQVTDTAFQWFQFQLMESLPASELFQVMLQGPEMGYLYYVRPKDRFLSKTNVCWSFKPPHVGWFVTQQCRARTVLYCWKRNLEHVALALGLGMAGAGRAFRKQCIIRGLKDLLEAVSKGWKEIEENVIRNSRERALLYNGEELSLSHLQYYWK